MSRFHPHIAVLLCVLANAGCVPEEPIVQYRVPKAKEADHVTSADTAWFIKLTGPALQVQQQMEPFVRLLAETRFSAKGPEFDLPEGWKQEAGDNFRFATLRIETTDPPLEVSVSSLPYESSQRDGYTLSNVNRWRGQLGLEAWPEENWRALARQTQQLVSFDVEQHHLEVVRLGGQSEQFGPTMMLAAMFLPIGANEAPAQSMADMPVQTAPAPFQYDLPSGWEVGQGNSVRIASFKATGEGGDVDVSVTRFPGGGDLLPNVNRWRGQVKLPEIGESELSEALSPVDVGGVASQLGEFIGSEESIIVAAVPDGDSQWFFKGQGPVAAVAREREKFLAFLQSVRFE